MIGLGLHKNQSWILYWQKNNIQIIDRFATSTLSTKYLWDICKNERTNEVQEGGDINKSIKFGVQQSAPNF